MSDYNNKSLSYLAKLDGKIILHNEDYLLDQSLTVEGTDYLTIATLSDDGTWKISEKVDGKGLTIKISSSLNPVSIACYRTFVALFEIEEQEE